MDELEIGLHLLLVETRASDGILPSSDADCIAEQFYAEYRGWVR